jgi:translation initiation factor 2 subunit 1
VFTEVARENVTPPYVQISGIIELKCPKPDGVDMIRSALLKGLEPAKDRAKIQYVGAPRYRIVISAPDYKTAEEELKEITSQIIESIKTDGGEGDFHRDAKGQ